jgi:hypothetical protein
MATDLSPAGSAEQIREEATRSERLDAENFRKRAAVALAILAALLALCNLGGEYASKSMLTEAISAADASVSHESAVTRQLSYLVSANSLDAVSQLGGSSADAAARQQIANLAAQQRAIAEQPPPADPNSAVPAVLLEGNSIQDLETQVREHEANRVHFEQQDDWFAIAIVMLEISLVLGSVSILILSRILLCTILVSGTVGALLGLNALLLVVPMPF